MSAAGLASCSSIVGQARPARFVHRQETHVTQPVTQASRPAKKSPRWAVLQPFSVSKRGVPYLFRWRLLQTPWFSLLVHHIKLDDLDRDPHDHPWPFTSLILCGSYREHVWDDPRTLNDFRVRDRRRFSIATTTRNQAHQITILHGSVWTIAITGRHHGTWHFWTPAGPIDWREYEDAGDDTTRKGWRPLLRTRHDRRSSQETPGAAPR
jgi:hypothetical protein